MSSSEAEMGDDQTNRGFSMFLPVILGFTIASSPQSQEGENQTVPEGFALINPLDGEMIVIEGTGTFDPSNREGPLPASKASIEAMPAVKVIEEGLECSICLGDFEVGGEAKAMPCNHRFHSVCIEKWLGIHGSCPVCRYKMPVDEGEMGKGSDGDERENIGRRVEGEIRISFFFEN
ncbi:E3 ubiquitin-protein ligase MPSR1-like [Actinidia eriantha]|uniref:E3 ubiquitin-protein ligase MPSR1-like n=1 Tax=Actinidia eriantha TaxID=165200 RepID=UPI00258E6695|nr:E3 ubiquitin-protein ligase MPSR1-like [Actinidia eriantha]